MWMGVMLLLAYCLDCMCLHEQAAGHHGPGPHLQHECLGQRGPPGHDQVRQSPPTVPQ